MDDLYRENILEHYKRPHNWGRPAALPEEGSEPEAYRAFEDHNPLCGDRCTVYLKMDGDKIAEYGLAALVVGGAAAVAAKSFAPFLKGILLAVAAAGGAAVRAAVEGTERLDFHQAAAPISRATGSSTRALRTRVTWLDCGGYRPASAGCVMPP